MTLSVSSVRKKLSISTSEDSLQNVSVHLEDLDAMYLVPEDEEVGYLPAHRAVRAEVPTTRAEFRTRRELSSVGLCVKGLLLPRAQVFAVFDTFVGKNSDFFLGKAVGKMEKAIGEKVPDLKLLAHGLSIRVGGTKGPIVEGEHPKCRDFGREIGNLLIARHG